MDVENWLFDDKNMSGRMLKTFYEIEDKLKKDADASGNPKIWIGAEYSQDFPKSLISGKI